MLITILITCHNKPKYTPQAIESVLRQTHQEWEGVIFDSGVMYDQGYYEKFTWLQDNRLKLIRSDETEEMRTQKNMASWCYNECIRRGLVNGELVSYLCDDDILYPNFFSTFVEYATAHPDVLAMYASQDHGWVYSNGREGLSGERRADVMAGRCCQGKILNCQVDYLQFCHRRKVLDMLGDPWWPEGAQWRGNADGVFMENVGAKTPIYPIDIKVSLNRRTPQSILSPQP